MSISGKVRWGILCWMDTGAMRGRLGVCCGPGLWLRAGKPQININLILILYFSSHEFPRGPVSKLAQFKIDAERRQNGRDEQDSTSLRSDPVHPVNPV